MKKDDSILNNPLFDSLEKVGHKAKDDIYVWSQGLGLHNHNLIAALKEVVDKNTATKILKDLWKFFHSVNLKRQNKVLGVEAEPKIDHLNKILADIMNQIDHPAIMGMGENLEEAILNWVKAFAVYDFAVYT